jgi:hypothetical protein
VQLSREIVNRPFVRIFSVDGFALFKKALLAMPLNS